MYGFCNDPDEPRNNQHAAFSLTDDAAGNSSSEGADSPTTALDPDNEQLRFAVFGKVCQLASRITVKHDEIRPQMNGVHMFLDRLEPVSHRYLVTAVVARPVDAEKIGTRFHVRARDAGSIRKHLDCLRGTPEPV